MDYERGNFFQKNATWIVAVVAIVLFALIFYKGWGQELDNQVDKTATITGHFSCLPFKTGEMGPCELGLKSGKAFYALDVSRVQDANTDLKAEDTIAVTGFVRPAEDIPETSDFARYDVKGVIQVNTLLRTR